MPTMTGRPQVWPICCRNTFAGDSSLTRKGGSGLCTKTRFSRDELDRPACEWDSTGVEPAFLCKAEGVKSDEAEKPRAECFRYYSCSMARVFPNLNTARVPREPW